MPWPVENEVVRCEVCDRKIRWVGPKGSTYTVLDGPPNEPAVTLVCKECETLMDHFGFSTYAMKRFLDLENMVQQPA